MNDYYIIATKSEASVHLNQAGASHCRKQVEAGNIDHGEWNGAATPRDAAHGDWFLGVDSTYKPSEASYWKYPVCSSDGSVNRKAVGSAAGYAEKNGETDIARVATELGNMMDKHNG